MPSTSRSGLVYGLCAYLIWGTLPLYWKLVRHVPALEILGDRVVFGLIAFGATMLARRQTVQALRALRNARVMRTLAMSATLLAVNWFTFVYAVETDRVLEASIGYFLNPLLYVLFGVVVLGERLRRMQALAVVLAGVGVAFLASRAPAFPWIGLVLAVSFALYGLIRKTVAVDAVPGSTIEAGLLFPFALAYMIHLALAHRAALGSDARTTLLLVLTGVATAVPLICFAEAARRLRLSTLGFLQYLAPTGQLLLAVVVFGEPFTAVHAASFGLVWVALAVFSVDAVRAHRAQSVLA